MLTTLILSGLTFPQYYHMPYPKPLGAQAQFDAAIQKGGRNAIAELKPEIVLIGDSVLYTGVENSDLTKYLGAQTYMIAVPGSGSAIWYLILKNLVIASGHSPRFVVIPFNDTLLTLPSFRTTGHYFFVVDEYAGRNEPLVLQKAYLNAMNPLDKAAEQYLPLYSARWELREALNRRLRYSPAGMFGCAQACADAALGALFSKEEMSNINSGSRPIFDSATVYTRAAFDFNARVGDSFLPDMLQLAKQHHITMVFVRMKNMYYPTVESEPPGLTQYIRNLESYLAEYDNARFITLAHDSRIPGSYFADAVHFTAEGRAAFTKILADELSQFLK